MIHSASFRATGSAIVASAWVASAGLCLRTSSMTFSSALLSACEVDEVAAIAAGEGLRTGGKAACRRVAGARIGGRPAGAIVAGVVNLTGAAKTGAVFFVDAWSTMLRAIGRALGNGTLGLPQASAPKADKPTTS